MDNNIDFKNLYQYKYVYKFYFANKKLNVEKFQIVYINKKQVVYVENDKAITTPLSYFYTKDGLDNILETIAQSWYRDNWSIMRYMIAKEKLDVKNIKISPTAKEYFAKEQIKNLKRNIEKTKRDIELAENRLQRLVKEKESLELELGEKNEEHNCC